MDFYLPLVMSCFPDLSLSLCACIDVCAFVEVVTSSSLYRFVLVGKDFY